MKALILAAGEGTRLEPLTNVRPKPMLPVANKPLLEHVVEAVIEAGIRDIVLVVGYKRERIQNHFGDGDHWNADISYVFQDPQLGTGDAIRKAKSDITGEFVVLNGDRITDSTAITDVIEARSDYDAPTLAVTVSVPYDRAVHRSIRGGVPVVMSDPDAPASKAYDRLATRLATLLDFDVSDPEMAEAGFEWVDPDSGSAAETDDIGDDEGVVEVPLDELIAEAGLNDSETATRERVRLLDRVWSRLS